jgi:hypothetical protein
LPEACWQRSLAEKTPAEPPTLPGPIRRTFRPARASTGGLADAQGPQAVLPNGPQHLVRAGRWQQINLGPDREVAFSRYHELMGRPRAEPQPVAADAVLGVLDAFLEWCSKHKAGRTYD